MKQILPNDNLIFAMEKIVDYLMLSGYSEEKALLEVVGYLDFIEGGLR